MNKIIFFINLFKELNSKKKKTERNKIIIQSQLNANQEFVCEESSVINSSSTYEELWDGLWSCVLRNFLFATEKGHETTVSHSLGFPASIRSDPPGISEYVYRSASSLSPTLPQPWGPEISGLLSRWNGRRDKTQHKGKLSSTTRHGNRVAGRGVVATRRTRKERKVYFSGGSKRPRFMYALTCWRGARFFFRIS